MPDLSTSGASIAPQLSQKLRQQAKADKHRGISALFEQDANRVNNFSFELEGIYFDLSKTHISSDLIKHYSSHATDIDFDTKRHQLLSGVKINRSENRSVLHTLLRDFNNQGIETEDSTNIDQAKRYAAQLKDKYRDIKQQLDSANSSITDIIHVGIGGSSLGTQLLFEALCSLSEKIKIHFIGNIDAHHLSRVLQQCQVESTLVIGVSKTFGTAETLCNISSIGDWFAANGVIDYISRVYAVTANSNNALKFGVPEHNIVQFAEWVGGRYSLWSAVSLSAILLLGMKKFDQLLAGAAAIDRYFYRTDVSQNICFLTASLDHYYTNYWSLDSRAIFPYDYRLRSLVSYLQQLETESNGKDRQINGDSVDQKTSAVVWGGVGTDVQHSVFQMMHQGTSIIPAEFILVAKADHDLLDHQTKLLANGIAQTAALLAGQSLQEVMDMDSESEISEQDAGAKVFSGERPSTTILLHELSPYSLGALLAFYEHRTFCGGLITNINSFDQMGVELGKRLASQVEDLLNNSDSVVEETGFDPSSISLIKKLLSK